MSSLSLYQEIFKRQKIDYVVCDASRHITEYSPGVIRYAQRISGPLRGQPLERLFDLLNGMGDDLDQVIQSKLPQLAIEKIHNSSNAQAETYFSVRIYPYQQGLLVLLVDVTEEGILEQRVTQQRNELDLLSGQLARSRAELDDLLHRFIPSQVADRIISHPRQVEVGGEKRFITALFADMRGFTQLSEVASPEIMLDMLNQHFDLLGRVISSYGGAITNFAGDSILAIFNAPDEQPEHAHHATLAGLEIQKTLRGLYAEPRLGMPFVFDFGVGINSGWAVVGYLGYENRLEYTAIGDLINVTARLSGLAKAGQVLVTSATRQLLADKIQMLSLGEMALRGRYEPVQVYEALELESE
jgi:adenylate cyclase